MRVAAGLGTHDRDAHLGEHVPVRVELARRRVEELEPRQVRRAAAVADHRRVERAAEVVDGQQVLPGVAHERDAVGDRRQRPLQAGPRRHRSAACGDADAPRWGCRRRPARGRAGAPRSVSSSCRARGDGVEHGRRRAGDRAALELGVVLHAHAGQARDLAAPQPGHAPVRPAQMPAASGVTPARRVMRNSRTSARLSTPLERRSRRLAGTVGRPARGTSSPTGTNGTRPGAAA